VAALGASVPASTAAPVRLCNGLPATIVGTTGDDDIAGTNGDDVIVGLAGNDIIAPKAGDDTVCGNGGADVLWDESGDDVLIGGDGDDEAVAGSGRLVVRLGAGTDYFDTFSAPGPLDLWLGPGDDKLDTTAPQGGSINAGAGDDQLNIWVAPGVGLSLVGGDGADIVDLQVDDSAGSAQVLISERTGRMRIGDGPAGRVRGWDSYGLWGDHDWVFRGTNGTDRVFPYDGRLRAHLYGGDDLAVVRQPGPHYIDAGSGYDFVDGSRYYDTCLSVELGSCAPDD
jgi:hypothetical protein